MKVSLYIKITQIMRWKIRCIVPTCRVQHIENKHRSRDSSFPSPPQVPDREELG